MRQHFEIEQNTPEWDALRLGIPTSSEFATVRRERTAKTRTTYLLKKVGERLTGEPAESYSNRSMERGHQMQQEALDAYSMLRDIDLLPGGFWRFEEGSRACGASPDALVGDAGIVEVKTAAPHIQLERVILGRMPPEHVAQVQGLLWVTGREWVDFISYWPRLRMFRIRVERDEEYISALERAVYQFCDELNELTESLR